MQQSLKAHAFCMEAPDCGICGICIGHQQLIPIILVHFPGSSQLLFVCLLLSQLLLCARLRDKVLAGAFISRFKALASLWHCRLHSRIEAHHLSRASDSMQRRTTLLFSGDIDRVARATAYPLFKGLDLRCCVLLEHTDTLGLGVPGGVQWVPASSSSTYSCQRRGVCEACLT